MIYLNRPFAVSALGLTTEETLANLRDNKSAYFAKRTDFLPDNQSTPLVDLPLPDTTHQQRNIALADYCIEYVSDLIDSCISKYGKDRIAVVAGTSTSAITEVEKHLKPFFKPGHPLPFDPNIVDLDNISAFVKCKFDLQGPCYTVATACSSAARATVSAAKLIQSQLCDAVIVLSADSLSKISIGGFYALGALSTSHCLPFHRHRSGINIGEGAGVMVVSRERLDQDCIQLCGYGSSSDAYHISSPSPDGQGAALAVKQALNSAGLSADQIGYVNAHGTATVLNDQMEGAMMTEIFPHQPPLSSTKFLTGHTLGSCALVEGYICSLILQHQLELPYHDYQEEDYRSEFPFLNLVTRPGCHLHSPYIMSNSFAFGGNNVSLIYGLAHD